MRSQSLRTLAVTAAAVALTVAIAGAASSDKARARPYPGAPPTVPHDLEDRKALCQDCHATGASGAPITPHPTRTHYCIACHVPQTETAKPFVSPVQPAAPR